MRPLLLLLIILRRRSVILTAAIIANVIVSPLFSDRFSRGWNSARFNVLERSVAVFLLVYEDISATFSHIFCWICEIQPAVRDVFYDNRRSTNQNINGSWNGVERSIVLPRARSIVFPRLRSIIGFHWKSSAHAHSLSLLEDTPSCDFNVVFQ